MKVGISLLALIVGVLAWQLYLAKSAHDFDLQEKCRLHAEKIFHQSWKELDPTGTASYQSHHNAKQNKCFMVITAYVFHSKEEQRFLLDAYEGRQYATYSYSDVTDSLSCSLTPPEEALPCKTSGDYQAFVAKYME